MKNIHVIQTDKPSRLAILGMSNTLQLFDKPITFKTFGRSPQNIYITSDEPIKEGDWFITIDTNEIHKSDWIKFPFYNGKKIILTDNQDLINDGVQAIDDEFLEWFVKNPSCEEVKIEKLDTFKKTNEVYIDEITKGNYCEIIKQYQIIIPKKELKQELPQFGTKEFYTFFSDLCDKLLGGKPKQLDIKELNKLDDIEIEEMSNDWGTISKQKEPKQETLEEAPKERLDFYQQGFADGFKIQQERMYSLDEIKTAMKNSYGIKYFSEHKFLKNLNNLKNK